MAEAFGVAASALAVAELSVKVISACSQYSKDVKHAREDIERFTEHVKNLEIVTKKLHELLCGPHQSQLQASQKLGDTLKGSQAQLRSLHDKLTPKLERGIKSNFRFRALKWPFESKEVGKILQELTRCTQPITTALQIDQTNILLSIDQKTVLSRLPIAEGAAFDSHAEEHNPTCLPDTRVDLLREIGEWIGDPAAKAVFWLNGMAGTGKSTISRTLAHTLSNRRQLGASFFFKRGEGDRGGASKFFTTIAAQLVQQEPALAPHVKDAIDTDPAITEKALRQQLEKLISEPLSQISFNRTHDVLVIIIDALDECENENNIKQIIHLLTSVDISRPQRLKIFMTSRPETPIRFGLKKAKDMHEQFILHEISESVVEHDISAFLQHELSRIRDQYNNESGYDQLHQTWPGKSTVTILAKMAVPLFIFAATVCRFIEDNTGWDSPNIRLEKILALKDAVFESELDKIDATYRPILDHLLAGKPTPPTSLVQEFCDTVGSIILLAQPLSVNSLAELLCTTPRTIQDRLKSLHSVLSVPSKADMPVRLFHKSFHDFLTHPRGRSSNPFWVDKSTTHKRLAAHCIRVMEKVLCTDLCEVKWPGTRHASIDPQTVDSKLPPEVKYACQYWIHHLQHAGEQIVDDDKVHRFLQRHFLHWLEALSLIGRVSECLQSIALLQSLLQSGNRDRVLSFIDDAIRFARTNISTIRATPLQVYCSALVFAPEKSIIRTTFQNDAPDWISLRPNVDLYWNNCLQILDGHDGVVQAVTFSPDGTVIASGSNDATIRLWSSATGEYLQILDGHTNTVASIAFSPDGTFIASGSHDSTVRLWLFATGEHLRTFKGHTDAVSSISFSPDSRVIASGSWDNTIRLWSSTTGEHLRTFEGHTRRVYSIAFSPDGRVIASGSNDSTIRLWSSATGEHLQTFKGHARPVWSIAFSPNSTVIASGSDDNTIRLWSSTTGEHLQTFEGHTSMVYSIEFSPDSTVIASGSGDRTIRLWSSTSGKHLQSFKGHTESVNSIAFSPDGTVMASGSADYTIRLWPLSAARSDDPDTPESHTSYITSVAISPGGTIVALGSTDKTIRIWSLSAAKSECLYTLEGHTNRVRSVIFSPDGTILASGSDDETIRLWSVSAVGSKYLYILEGHTHYVNSVAFSPDGTILASGSYDKTIRLWSVSAVGSKYLYTLEDHADYINSVAFSPDGTILASGLDDKKTIMLWSISAVGSKYLCTLKGHTNYINSVVFSPNSTILASGSSDGTIRLWSGFTSTPNCLGIIDLGISLYLLSFDSDSQFLRTEAGAISLGDLVMPTLTEDHNSNGPCTPHLDQALANDDESHLLGYGINKDRSWITFNKKDLLWLPVDFRPRHKSLAILRSTIAISTDSGRAVFMRFRAEGPALDG